MYASSVRSIPSGSTSFISASALARPSIPPSSYCVIHFWNAPVETWFASQNSLILIRGLLRYCLMRNSFSNGFRCFDTFWTLLSGRISRQGSRQLRLPVGCSFGRSKLRPQSQPRISYDTNFAGIFLPSRVHFYDSIKYS